MSLQSYDDIVAIAQAEPFETPTNYLLDDWISLLVRKDECEKG